MNYTEWIGQCPLRLWREINKISANEAAAKLGVTTPTIHTWEKGGTEPNEKNYAAMRNSVGENFSTDFMKWYSRKGDGFDGKS